MQTAGIFTALAIFSLSAAPLLSVGSAAEPADAIVLKSRSFDFPLTVDSGTQGSVARLYVSPDRGKTWTVASEQPLSSKTLSFEGTADGEFWFTIATDDETAGDRAADLQVQRKVIIDTTGPAIRLSANPDADGGVSVNLKLDDDRNVTSLRVLFATDVTRQWETIENQSIDENGGFRFKPDQDWRQLTLHITATDSLGNVSVEARNVRRPRVASVPLRSSSQPAGAGPATNRLRVQTVAGPAHPSNLFAPATASTPTNSRPINNAPANGNPAGGQNAAKPPTPSSTPKSLQLPSTGLPAKTTVSGIEVIPPPQNPQRAPQSPPGMSFGPPSLNGSNNYGGPITKAVGPESIPKPNAEPDPEAKRTRTLAEAMRPLDAPSPTGQAGGPSVENIPTPTPSETPQDRARYRAERAEQENRLQQERFDRARLARTVPFRFSDSNRFSLDYELEAIGATGIQAVELYGSTDSGNTWERWGADADNKSPFDIATKGEGLFTFRIVVLGNNGLASPRPLSGDPPDIAIVVDQTRPTAKITSARYGEGDRTGALVIRYQCEDENLMPRPIAFAFSDSLEGPWTTITAGLRNDGVFVWPADPKLPRQIYLRLDATDKAGNVGTYLLEQPINTRGLAPRARILGIQAR